MTADYPAGMGCESTVSGMIDQAWCGPGQDPGLEPGESPGARAPEEAQA